MSDNDEDLDDYDQGYLDGVSEAETEQKKQTEEALQELAEIRKELKQPPSTSKPPAEFATDQLVRKTAVHINRWIHKLDEFNQLWETAEVEVVPETLGKPEQVVVSRQHFETMVKTMRKVVDETAASESWCVNTCDTALQMRPFYDTLLKGLKMGAELINEQRKLIEMLENTAVEESNTLREQVEDLRAHVKSQFKGVSPGALKGIELGEKKTPYKVKEDED